MTSQTLAEICGVVGTAVSKSACQHRFPPSKERCLVHVGAAGQSTSDSRPRSTDLVVPSTIIRIEPKARGRTGNRRASADNTRHGSRQQAGVGWQNENPFGVQSIECRIQLGVAPPGDDGDGWPAWVPGGNLGGLVIAPSIYDQDGDIAVGQAIQAARKPASFLQRWDDDAEGWAHPITELSECGAPSDRSGCHR